MMMWMCAGRARTAWGGWWRGPGGGRELLRVAWPLILTNSFWALQIALDRILLSRAGPELVAAAVAAAFLFWTPLTLFQSTVRSEEHTSELQSRFDLVC